MRRHSQPSVPHRLSACCVSTGGYFDPLGLASDGDAEKIFRLKTAEIKHARLAMVAFLGECRCCCWMERVQEAGAILSTGESLQGTCSSRHFETQAISGSLLGHTAFLLGALLSVSRPFLLASVGSMCLSHKD
jgi:hypothetical protein